MFRHGLAHIATSLLIVFAYTAHSEPPTAAADKKDGSPRTDLHGDPLPPGAIARLGTTRLRQGNGNPFVAYSVDGKLLVSAARDGIHLWEPATGKEIGHIPYKDLDETAVIAASPDGRLVAVATKDRTLTLWDTATRKELSWSPGGEKTAETGWMRMGVTFSRNGKTLAWWCEERDEKGWVRFWDVPTGKELGPTRNFGWGMLPTGLSPDGRTLVHRGGENEKVVLLDIATYKQVWEKAPQGLMIHQVEFSPDGKTLAACCSVLDQEKKATSLCLWDVVTGKEVHRFGESESRCYCPTFSADGTLLAACNGDKIIRVWDVKAGNELASLNTECSPSAFSPDGKFLVTIDRSGADLWEIATGKVIRRLPGWEPYSVTGLYNTIVLFSPDGKTLAIGGQNRVYVWDVASGKSALPFAGHNRWVSSLAFSADGKSVTSLGSDRSIHVWETRTGREKGRLILPEAAAPGASPLSLPALVHAANNKIVAVEGNYNQHTHESDSIHVWDACAGKVLQHLRQSETGWVQSYATDGRTLVTCQGGIAKTWDLATGKELEALNWFPKDHEPDRTMRPLVAISPDGKTIATAGGEFLRQGGGHAGGSGELIPIYGVVRLWEARTGKQRGQFETLMACWQGDLWGPVRGLLAFSPDGRLLALGNNTTIALWDLATGKELRRVGGEGVMAETAVFSPDGRFLAAMGDGSLHLWEIATGMKVLQMNGHRGPLTCFAFSRDSRLLATGAADTTVLVWELAQVVHPTPGPEAVLEKKEPDAQKPVPASDKLTLLDLHGDPLPDGAIARMGTARLRHGQAAPFVAYSPDGKLLVSANREKVFLWDPATGKQIGCIPHGYADESNSPVLSADGKILATINSEKSLQLWDIATGQELPWSPGRQRQEEDKPFVTLTSAYFSGNGKTLVWWWEDERRQRIFRIWDVPTGTELEKVSKLATALGYPELSLDGKILVFWDKENHRILLINSATGEEIRQIPSPDISWWAFIFSPDGKIMAGGVERQPSEGQVAPIRLWDMATGKEIRSLGDPQWQVSYQRTFSPDGEVFAQQCFATKDNRSWQIHMWETATGKQLPPIIRADFMDSFIFSPDSKYLATLDRDKVCLCEVATGKELYQLQREPYCRDRKRDRQTTLAFSPDGKTLAVSGYRQVYLWDVATGKRVHQLGGHDGLISAIVFTPDGKSLASMKQNLTTHFWEARTGKEQRRLDTPGGCLSEVPAFAITLDNKALLGMCLPVTDGELCSIGVWDLTAGKIKHRVPAPFANFRGRYAALSADGKTLVMMSADNMIQITDLATGKELRQFSWCPENKDAAWGTTVAVSSDGRSVATLGVIYPPDHFRGREEPGISIVRLWDRDSGEQRGQFQAPMAIRDATRPNLATLAFSPDDKALLLAGGDTISLCGLPGGKEFHRFGGDRLVSTSVTLSPDGRLLGALDTGGTVHLWDVATSTHLVAIKGHEGTITCFAFSRDSRLLATAGSDTTILVWDLARVTDARPDKKRVQSAKELELLWSNLGSEDAAVAYRAGLHLAASPEQAVPFMQQKLQPAQPADHQLLRRLITDLDSAEFRVRQKAALQLAEIGDLAESALKTALAGQPSPELEQAVQRLLTQIASEKVPPDVQRTLHAVEALEHAGTSEAQYLLEALAKGAPESRLTRRAKASLERLGMRSGSIR